MTVVPQRSPIGRDASKAITTSTQGSTLADVLERVLDKGIVIAGDISISVATTELINIRIRLLIASVDKAREMGINWWENNPHFSQQSQTLLEANRQLMERVEGLEAELRSLRQAPTQTLPSQPASLANSFETLLGDL
ncbi:MAG: gas vesicle protein [Leptolyngbyaceae cyanobacterium CSU_1_3]|nr:gas vesicle protein [Leptolyngbyaceae cyanobacterium CSU_1_3]